MTHDERHRCRDASDEPGEIAREARRPYEFGGDPRRECAERVVRGVERGDVPGEPPRDQVGHVLGEPHEAHEHWRKQEGGRDEEHDRQREAVVAPGRDEQALGERGGAAEAREQEPVLQVGRLAGDGDDGRDRRGGRYREEERAGAGREVVRGRAAAPMPEQVPPQPGARFAVRWDLHGGRGSLELCLSLPTTSRAFRGWWIETTSDGVKRRRGSVHDAVGRSESVHEAAGERESVHDALMRWESVHEAALASAGKAAATATPASRDASATRDAVRARSAAGARVLIVVPPGSKWALRREASPWGESFDRRGATAAVPPAEGSATPRTRDSLAGHEAWARRSQVV